MPFSQTGTQWTLVDISIHLMDYFFFSGERVRPRDQLGVVDWNYVKRV